MSGNTFSVSFNDQEGTWMVPQSLRVRGAEFEHEIAIFRISGASPDAKRYQSGVAVRVVWGQQPNALREFVGYVNHSTPRASGGKEPPTLDIVCVGPTWPMKNAGYRTYRNATVTSVMRSVAAEYRLDVSNIDVSDRIWPALHQGGKSDWEFLCHLARKVGWTFFARGTSLFAMSYEKAMRYGKSDMVVIRPQDPTGVHENEFSASFGTIVPEGGDLAVRDVYGVNPRTMRVLSSRNKSADKGITTATAVAPLVRRAETDLVFNDFGEASQDLQARERANKLAIEGQIKGGKFKPLARPGSVALLLGFGPQDDGYWFIKSEDQSTQSVIDSEMKLVLGRDSVDTGDVLARMERPPTRPSRLITGRWVRG